MRKLYLKDNKLYKKGLFGWLSFVNYEYNKEYYLSYEIIMEAKNE